MAVMPVFFNQNCCSLSSKITLNIKKEKKIYIVNKTLSKLEAEYRKQFTILCKRSTTKSIYSFNSAFKGGEKKNKKWLKLKVKKY